jgi:hypothetical protein
MNDLSTQESPQSSTPLQKGQLKAVYTIIDRPGHEKKLWLRIGTAYVNRDLSINVKLDAHPANNQLHIRDAELSGYQRRADADGFPRREPELAVNAPGGVS